MVSIRNGVFKCPNEHIGVSFIRFAYDENTEIESIILHCDLCKREFVLA